MGCFFSDKIPKIPDTEAQIRLWSFVSESLRPKKNCIQDARHKSKEKK